VTVSGNYPTESIFAFRKPSVGRLVGNNPFRFHPYRYAKQSSGEFILLQNGADSGH
jgi:hypothetical protein